MKPTRLPDHIVHRNRRLGRKTLQADKLSSVLAKSQPKQNQLSRLLKVPSARTALAITAGVVVLLSVGAVAYSMHSDQVATAEKKAAAIQNVKLKAKSDAADACRRQKAQEKSELIGKVTYDELYDYGACDK